MTDKKVETFYSNASCTSQNPDEKIHSTQSTTTQNISTVPSMLPIHLTNLYDDTDNPFVYGKRTNESATDEENMDNKEDAEEDSSSKSIPVTVLQLETMLKRKSKTSNKTKK